MTSPQGRPAWPLAVLRLLVVWCAGLWILHLLSIPWTATTSALALAVGLGIAGRGLARDLRAAGTPTETESAWGESALGLRRAEDVLCGSVFSLFAVATFLGWNVMSDYVFHWGIKGKRFATAGGLDFEFLSQSWNYYLHPDYPNLISSLYASLMLLTGSQSWHSASWVSILGFALLTLSTRHLADVVLGAGVERVLAVGIVLFGCLGFAMNPAVAGGGELFIAVTFLLGTSALWDPTADRARALVFWAAALSAGAQMEGMVASAILLILYASALLRAGRGIRQTAIDALQASWASLLVVGFWLYGVLKHGLFLESNSAGLGLDRVWPVIRGMTSELSDPWWHGLPWVLVLLPILFTRRPFRLPATLIAIQLAFYVYAYLSGPVDTELWIRTSAVRLYFHLLPATLVLLIAFWCRDGSSRLGGPPISR